MQPTIDRNTPDVITNLFEGDVLDDGRNSYRIIKAELGWIRNYAWLKFDGRSKPDLVPGDNIFDTFANSKSGDRFRYDTNGMTGTYLGEVQWRSASVKVVDASFVGVPKKKDVKDLYLALYLSGDKDAFKKYVKGTQDIDMERFKVTPGAPSEIAPAERFTKWELIPYVVAVNGPMPKEEILRQVQRLQGRPYVPGSNHSYFMDDARGRNFGLPEKKGVVSRGLLKVDHKKGNTLVYGLGELGKAEAKRLINALGQEPGKAV